MEAQMLIKNQGRWMKVMGEFADIDELLSPTGASASLLAYALSQQGELSGISRELITKSFEIVCLAYDRPVTPEDARLLDEDLTPDQVEAFIDELPSLWPRRKNVFGFGIEYEISTEEAHFYGEAKRLIETGSVFVEPMPPGGWDHGLVWMPSPLVSDDLHSPFAYLNSTGGHAGSHVVPFFHGSMTGWKMRFRVALDDSAFADLLACTERVLFSEVYDSWEEFWSLYEVPENLLRESGVSTRLDMLNSHYRLCAA
ncbi:hypothetical protein D6779_02295 [Candidatus Parcubacteria bacterium]|nr:MAG: hypothetical protein D6779_02295 [Candidatus Parcubacteria bacterium]